MASSSEQSDRESSPEVEPVLKLGKRSRKPPRYLENYDDYESLSATMKDSKV